MSKTTPKKRCAIYTRKSTEEGLDMEFNSLDAQREACESYIASQKHEGWFQLPDNYDDGGFTGGNMDRPALKRLMDDIKSGLIDTVVVYKVDRLSRSLADFAKLIDLFDEHKVSFVSVTQQFNTTTSMGRLTLNILLSFAQFEREVIGERIRDKLVASKRKGMWMGGVTPMGYVVKNRELVIEPDEAEGIRKIFDLFLMTKSPTEMAKMLPRMGVLSKKRTTKNGRVIGGKALDKGGLYKILQNPIYIGKIKHKDQIYEGRHPAIIDMDTWNKVRVIMKENTINRGAITRKKTKAILMGLLKCGECECSLVPSHTRKKGGRLYRYYTCEHYRKDISPDCKIRNVSANEMEALILTQLQAFFVAPEMVMETWRAIQNDDDSVTEYEVHSNLSDIVPIWKELYPAEKQRILELMIKKVIVNYEYVDVPYPGRWHAQPCTIIGRTRKAAARNFNPTIGGASMDARIKMMEGNVISVRVPIKIKRYGGKKLILLPEGAHMTAPQEASKPDETLVKALSKAYYWQNLIDTERYTSIDDLSRKRKINPSYVSRILRLNQLSPQIKTAILDGTQPRQLSLQDMQTPFPDIWNEQLKHFGFMD